MTIWKPAFVAMALLIGACATEPSDMYAVAPEPVTQSVRIAFKSVEVRDVSLPTYAAADEIAIAGENGKLVTNSNVRWADNPERAVALELSRNIARLSGARVASEPWPFENFADARLEVRFESLIAQTDGRFRASGQYFVGVEDITKERSGLFNLSVLYDPNAGPQAIAQARGKLILRLAELIAQNGLR